MDVEKPRDVQNVRGISVPFEMGSLIRVNNAQGVPVVSIGGTQEILFNFIMREKEVVMLRMVYK